METKPLLSTSGLIGQQPDYEALRSRDISSLLAEQTDEENEQASKRKCTWKHALAILIIVVVTGLLLAVFLPPRLNAFNQTESIFGGAYTIAHNHDYNVANHYTEDTSCPEGYSSYIVAHFLACYECGGSHLYLCLKDDATEDPRGFFGGMYNSNNCGGKKYENPLTSSFGCDTDGGYDSYLAIASQTDDDCDTNVYVCLKGQKLDYYNLGGFYTSFSNKIESESTCSDEDGIDDDTKLTTCEDKNVDHYLVHSLDCPERYEHHLIAHIYSPGATEECPGCNGRAYICLMPESEIDDKENDDILGAQHP